ncbi:hypothetical protein TRAPUB_6079 [Trametes pubescens]|uniref:BTB domain-containing protein n=1 Tax=Trametes pubescens TaxID=154538 RepID=A0A1M2V6T9_TRAPU|nr:hypothetical protein TRAPUB_6079 [Trametes pubescens]
MSSTTSSSSDLCASRSSTPLSDELEPSDSEPRPSESAPISELFTRPAVEVVVRSVDDDEFYMPRRFLVDASPVLEDMCNARPSPSDRSAISIDLPETSEAVQALLRLCHPLAPEPRFPSYRALTPAVPLCWSYKLRGAARERVMRALQPWFEKRPVRVYVFAVGREIPELVAMAAKESLRIAGTLDDHPELDTVSGREYRRLLVYRKACCARMADITSYEARIDEKWVWGSCGCRFKNNPFLAGWFNTFYAIFARALRRMPHPNTVRAMKLGEMEDTLKQAALCDTKCQDRCGTRTGKDLPRFLDQLADEVDRRISETVLASFECHKGGVNQNVRRSCSTKASADSDSDSDSERLRGRPSDDDTLKSKTTTVLANSYRQAEIHTAPPPFDEPAADLILRSSDGVNFRVFKWILGDASEVFADMFTLPAAPSVNAHGVSPNNIHEPPPPPIIPVTEESGTLEALLRMCYPLRKHTIPHFTSIAALYPVAAEKYRVDHAVEILAPQLVRLAVAEPVRAYAYAVRFNLPDLARDPARQYLRVQDTTADVPELATISGAAYHRLIVYRQRCSAAVLALSEGAPLDRLFLPPSGEWCWTSCDSCFPTCESAETVVSTWFQTYYQGLVDALRAAPCPGSLEPAAARLADTAAVAVANCCGCSCGARAGAELRLFFRHFKAAVERRIENGGTRTASSPFDKPSADLILRSSDGVDFRVFKWILSDASEVFAGMFSLPTPPPKHTGGTTSPGHIHQSSPPPVVPVTEHSRALEALLRLCYPLCVVPDYAQFEDLKPVVAAAHKYQVAHALRILEPRMQFFAVQDPVRVYAFATRYNLQDVARDAARNFLFAPDILVDAPELADISAAAYHRLLAYRWRCNLDVVLELKALPPRSSFPSPKGTPWVWENCSHCAKHFYDEDGRNCVAKWFRTFYGSLMDVLSPGTHNPEPLLMCRAAWNFTIKGAREWE